jgi:hypothetical protein
MYARGAKEGDQVPAAHVNAVVRLTHDVPTLWLSRGDLGVVQSIWFSPADCYEVEFRKPECCPTRAVLSAELFELVEPQPFRTGVEEEANEHE